MPDPPDSRLDITTPTVAQARSLVGVASTRALNKVQIARVRARIEQLLQEHGSQSAVSRLIGVSQQVIGKIHKGDAMGLYVARKLAKFDGVPLQVFLEGTPNELERAIREGADRWQEPTLAALRRYAINLPPARADSYDVGFWSKLLDKVEASLSPVLRDATRL